MSYNLPFTKCLHPVKVKTLRGLQLVKCGKCPACENSKRSELRSKVQFEETNCKATFFITLTYDNDNLPLFCLRSDLVSDDDKRSDIYGNVINDGFYLSHKSVDYIDLWSGHKIHFDSTSLADNNVGFFPLPDRIQTDNYNDKLNAWCVDSENSIYSRCILGKASEHFDNLLKDYHLQLQSNVAKCKALGITNNSLSWYDYVDSNYCFSHSDCVPLLYYPDLQRFMKRLRKYLSKYFKDEKIRYYAIGEYGTSSFRPHWHILLFTDSDSVARFLQNTFYENRTLTTSKRTVHSSFLLDSLWQYGSNSVDKTDGNASGYISNYVVGTSVLPKILGKLAPQKTFHSLRFGVPYSKGEIREFFVERNYERFSKIDFVDPATNTLQSRPLWRSYYSLFFPQFVGINSLSDEEKYRVLTIYPKLASYFFTDNVSELSQKIYFQCIKPYRDGKILDEVKDEINIYIAKFFDWFEWSSATSLSLSPLSGILYASKRFLNISKELGFTSRQYFDIWRDFVNWRDYKCLVQHYFDCRTNEIYLNDYYNIYCCGTDVKLDYLNNSSLFAAFRYDALRQNSKLVKHKALVEQLKGI
jgi:hypothetical protein